MPRFELLFSSHPKRSLAKKLEPEIAPANPGGDAEEKHSIAAQDKTGMVVETDKFVDYVFLILQIFDETDGFSVSITELHLVVLPPDF